MAASSDGLEAGAADGRPGCSGSSGVEVVFPSGPAAPAPLCPHGPTLLFVKVNQGKEETRRFYACSACRDRKDCSFFQWEDEKLSEARLAAREAFNQSCQPPLSRMQCVERLLRFVQLPWSQRKFCRRCQQLLLPEDWGEHGGHELRAQVSEAQLQRPSQLLHPLENKKTHAQYLFADRTCGFLVRLLSTLGFRRVLCVGTPRLHELIRLTAAGDKKSDIKSLLLDIDSRYSQFYMEDSFCHYNMFNHHFFDGKAALDVCRAFLQEDAGDGVIMVTDPPFGGLVEPLAITFKKLIAIWKEGQNQDNSYKELPIFWIFPYFFESRICQFFPSFSMLDYQVDYDNHALYKHGKTGRKQSPVRIFTNIPPHKIILPTEEGYRFCPLCQRYVSFENRHCEHCNSCTSKDGRKWKHCFLCRKCVKPSWIHCSVCGHCAVADHSCVGPRAGCFICGKSDHKRSTCPNVCLSRGANRAVRKQKQRKSNKMKMEATKGQSMNQTSVIRRKKRRERVHQYLCS
ncbi:rRNA N6-adenosine-methyltransferase ZCCHC4 isoform X2 [Perognathus longimembris pacificus]|uniref:rRNA N6-adenosine-methyltransferase ZCCHC4 isoform X2 n=1 Tax=Perognathus longimembris pacificus TaxID=214514 RepID=UPI0020194754|nr:rRNA N6-adenosine-methyltransferase ZCCHC4 isoform X2 [Perognathus longimembris pacificus]